MCCLLLKNASKFPNKSAYLKGVVPILTCVISKLIDLDLQDAFFTILPQAYFLFSLLGQRQVCDTGDEAEILGL